VSEPAPDPRAAAIYHEPARSYATVLGMLAVFVVGGVLDAALTHRVVHLIAWLVGAAIVCGILLVATRAANQFRSITVTDADVTVGESSLSRTSIVGFDRAVDPAAPVLGQTMREGLPKGVPGLALRLADGAVVALPTRRPDELAAVLALPEEQCDIRPGEPDDLAALEDIARRTVALYRVAGHELPADWSRTRLSDDAAAVFVLGRPVEGFVRIGELDGQAHLEAIAVVPQRLRSGDGARLLETAFDWCRARGYRAMTVTTFAELPWNASFFAKHGFAEITDLPPGLAELRDWERAVGLDAVGRRTAMRADLS
jgi:GNAT superfamily N-acetyltransferase